MALFLNKPRPLMILGSGRGGKLSGFGSEEKRNGNILERKEDKKWKKVVKNQEPVGRGGALIKVRHVREEEVRPGELSKRQIVDIEGREAKVTTNDPRNEKRR